MNKLLKEAVDRERTYSPQETKQVPVSFELDEQGIIGDKVRLMTGFREVIRNAIYATVRSVGRRNVYTIRDRSNVLISIFYMPQENEFQSQLKITALEWMRKNYLKCYCMGFQRVPLLKGYFLEGTA